MIRRVVENLPWLASWGWQRLTRARPGRKRVHVVLALADHFEPSFLPEQPGEFAPLDEQERRLERWCNRYPDVYDRWRDPAGHPFRRTYFFPAEQAHPALLERLVDHCRSGWGEVEVHLHHGVEAPDTAPATRAALERFRDDLAAMGALSYWDGAGGPRFGFVHGNWALANSAGGTMCGVDNELEILEELGCYADFTMPSAPHPTQVTKINSIYECALPLGERAPHRRGHDLRLGQAVSRFPVIVQGPLAVRLVPGASGLPVPKIENGAITARNPGTLTRTQAWIDTGIAIEGRPDWVFVKLHAHGMDPRDEDAMLGGQASAFVRELSEAASSGAFGLSFVTAREMVNIILAACDGREGTPEAYRNYRLRMNPTRN